MHSNATYRGRANILKRPNRLNVRSGSVAGPPSYPARTTAPIGCAPNRDIDVIPGAKPQVNVARERSIPVSA